MSSSRSRSCWGGRRLALRELLEVHPGSTIELDRSRNSPVDVLVNGTLFARGEIVVIDDSELGVQIEEVVVGRWGGTMTRANAAARGVTVLVSAVHRAATHHTTGPSTSADVSVGHVAFQMIVALVVVVGGVWGVGKVMGRSSRRSGSPAAKRGAAPLAVLSRQSLGKGLSLAAVRWGDREVLVGIAGSTITFLDDPRSDAEGGALPGRDRPRRRAAGDRCRSAR